MGITFVWIGFLIVQDPEAWTFYINKTIAQLLPVSLVDIMRVTGVVDIVIGVFLVLNRVVWIASAAAALHLFGVMVVSGVGPITVRDIGLFAAAVTLCIQSIPWFFEGKRAHNNEKND